MGQSVEQRDRRLMFPHPTTDSSSQGVRASHVTESLSFERETLEKFDTVVVVVDLVCPSVRSPRQMRWAKFEDIRKRSWHMIHEL